MTTIPITQHIELTVARSFDVTLTVADTITDEQAAGITFRAKPEQVRLGAFVQVKDAGGTRIGHLASATYHEPTFGPGYVNCAIKLT